MYLIVTEKETAAKRIAAILADNKVKKVRYPKLGTARIVTHTTLAVVLLYWILRNLPWRPFCLLAP